MLNKSISYRSILRITGVLFLILALYYAGSIAFTRVYVNSDTYWQYEIMMSFSQTFVDILWYGPLFYAAAGIVCLGLSARHLKVAYWSLQGALWIAGIALWYGRSSTLDDRIIPGLVTPLTLWPWMVITLLCSIILLALYKPVVYLLVRLSGERNHQPQEKEAAEAS